MQRDTVAFTRLSNVGKDASEIRKMIIWITLPILIRRDACGRWYHVRIYKPRSFIFTDEQLVWS